MGGTICCGHRRVSVVRSHGGVRFIAGIVSGHRRVYDVRSRSHITGGTICYWHRPVYVARSHITVGTICHWHRRAFVVRSHMTGVRFVTGIGVCLFRDHTSQRVRFVTGIGVCLLRDHTSQGVPFVTGIGVCMFRKSSSSDGYIYIYIYIYMGAQTSYLSICLSINLPLSILCIIGKKHLNPTLDTPAVALRRAL